MSQEIRATVCCWKPFLPKQRNCSIKSEEGRLIRGGWVAAEQQSCRRDALQLSFTWNGSHLAAFTLHTLTLCSSFSHLYCLQHTQRPLLSIILSAQQGHIFFLSASRVRALQRFITLSAHSGASDKITSWFLSNDTPQTAPGQSH